MVGGVAYHAGKKVQEGREDDARPMRAWPSSRHSRARRQAAPAAGGGTDDMIEQLGKLGQLHEQGVLTDDEFAAQKQKLLGGS